jgi:hypothetical protein
MDDSYQFDDLDTSAPAEPASSVPQPERNNNGNGGFSSELTSKQIKAKFRTFFIDLKESNNGKFLKISEKSHGRKSTIMMDAEDVPEFIKALQEIQSEL